MTGYWLLVTGFILFEGLLENRLFCVHLSLVISNMRVFCSSPPLGSPQDHDHHHRAPLMGANSRANGFRQQTEQKRTKHKPLFPFEPPQVPSLVLVCIFAHEPRKVIPFSFFSWVEGNKFLFWPVRAGTVGGRGKREVWGKGEEDENLKSWVERSQGPRAPLRCTTLGLRS